MHFTSYRQIQTLVEERLAGYNFGSSPSNLYDPIHYFMSLGGKRLRPVLVLMANDLFGGKPEQAFHTSIAVEVFHNFTLVHDDIMDKAELRRGKPTVHKKWNETVAILSGDLMMIKAIELLSQSDAAVFPELLKVFNAAAIGVCEGQQLDMDFEQREQVSVDEYIQMITLKTAVLLGAALQLGAITAGASTHDASCMYEFGKNIGIAFQIQDDLLDTFGDESSVGKTIGGDIAANKKTLLMVEARNRATEHDHQELDRWQLSTDLAAKINGTIDVFNRLDIRAVCETHKEHYLKSAFEKLEKISVSQDRKRLLVNSAMDLMNRIS
ncbi:MAG: polyprenyl synthetase family protein [Bacteroidota bacterium]|jgi:geranylgeranyl diphosphate synthase type II